MANQNNSESSGFPGCLLVVGGALLLAGLITGVLSGDMNKGMKGALWLGTEFIGAIVGVIAIVGFMLLISKK